MIHIYKKILKNVLLIQYYENYVKINEYFNRKLPLFLVVLLSVLYQISGGLLLTIFGMMGAEAIDGNLILLYFSSLAIVQPVFQAQKDYETYDSYYDESIFVYGYYNKHSVLSNAMAYGVLNMIGNPMVFIPAILYPCYWEKNGLFAVVFFLIPLLIYEAVFIKKDGEIIELKMRTWLLEVSYALKTIVLTGLVLYMMPKLLEVNGLDLIEEMQYRLIDLSDNLALYVGKIIAWIPIGLCIFLMIFTWVLLKRVPDCRYKAYGLCRKNVSSKWVMFLGNICKDVKVKNDLKIISRRRDLWRDNANAAFLIPNTVIIILIISVCFKNADVIVFDSQILLFTELVFSIVVISKFVFKNFSFLLFHNGELKSIDLYRSTGKDTWWLFRKKLGLLCMLTLPAWIVLGIGFMILGLYWSMGMMAFSYLFLTVFIGICVNYLLIYWMFLYRHRYLSYEEFKTKRIDMDIRYQFSAIPLMLLLFPFVMYLFDFLVGKVVFSEGLILMFELVILISSMLIATIVLLLSIRKWRKKYY